MTSHSTLKLTVPPPVAPVGSRTLEISGLALFLGAVMAIQIALSSPKLLLARPFWQDEQLTHFIASDPSLSHLLQAVRQGADTNPPIFHLLVRGFAVVVPGAPEVVYRLFILLTAWLGFIALYAILRRSFEVLPSVIAVLALWASPLILHEAFDARFYIPLLASSAFFALFFSASYRRRWLQDVLIALSAALLCTIHYFGIVALGGIVAGQLLLCPRQWRQTARNALPALAGPLALAAMFPFLLGQRAGLTVATWVPSFRPDQILDIATNLFATIPLAMVVLFAWVFRGFGAPPRQRPIPLHPMAGLTGLLLIPVVLTVFSVLVQPAMLAKYMIVSMLAVAPMLALLSTAAPRWGRVALIATLIGIGLLQLRHEAWVVDYAFELEQQHLVASCEGAIRQGLPVVAASRREAYTLYYAAPSTRGHLFVADIRPLIRQETGDDLIRHLVFETELAAKFEKLYPMMPPLLSVDALRKLGPFHLVGWDPWVAAMKRHVPLKHLHDDVYEVAGQPS